MKLFYKNRFFKQVRPISVTGIQSLIFFLLLGCAAVAPPPGGPEDKTPPSLIAVDPPSGTVNISAGFTTTLTFSERLDETTIEKGLRISPKSESPLKIRIKKEKLIITFPNALIPDQTYLLTVGRDIMDEHRNRLDYTYQLAFSTGEQISNGEIRGKVYNPFGKSSTIFLYNIKDRNIDSLFSIIPDYYTETDDSGYYSFSYLDPGFYQVLAVGVGISPGGFIPRRMPYGVHWESPLEVHHSDEIINHIDMKIYRESPSLNVTKIQMETAQKGVIRFTNPVKLSEQEKFTIVLESEVSEGKIIPEVIFQYRDYSDEIYFHSSKLISENKYLLKMYDVVDSIGQELSEYESEIFVPPKDTIQLEIVYPKRGEDISIQPGETPLFFQFNDVVNYDSSQTIVSLKKKSGEDIAIIPNWLNPTRLSIVPLQGWESEDEYELSLSRYYIFSSTGDTLSEESFGKDSLIVFQVRVDEDVGFGGMYGKVTGQYSENSIVVAASTEKVSKIHSTAVNSDGQFSFKLLPAGFWLLSTYQDRDRNGRYSYGKAIPFKPSEPFVLLPDTIEVRANWDVEGIVIQYPEKVESRISD